jgi:hypothetical protein
MNEHLSLVFPPPQKEDTVIPKQLENPITKVPSSIDSHSFTPYTKPEDTSQTSPTVSNQGIKSANARKVIPGKQTSTKSPIYSHQETSSSIKTHHTPTQSSSTTTQSSNFLLTSSEPIIYSSKVPNDHLTHQNENSVVQSINVHNSKINASFPERFNHAKEYEMPLKSSKQHFSTLKPVTTSVPDKNSSVNIPINKSNQTKMIHPAIIKDITHEETKVDLEVDRLIRNDNLSIDIFFR